MWRFSFHSFYPRSILENFFPSNSIKILATLDEELSVRLGTTYYRLVRITRRQSHPFLFLKVMKCQALVLPEAADRELQGHEVDGGARLAEAAT
jgi:hypothetical protein